MAVMAAASLSAAEEARRIALVRSLALLDSVPEPEYDAIVALAAGVLDMPRAYIALMDKDRLWYKAKHNLPFDQIPRGRAFCEHTLGCDDTVVVRDLARDARFADNPFVTGDSAFRFYAGVPLRVATDEGDSLAIGTLCVLDHCSRAFTDTQLASLRHLAALTEALIGARVAARRAADVAALAKAQADDLARQDIIFREAERMAQIGSWRLSLADEHIIWSEGVSRIHGLPVGTMPALTQALDFYPPAARARVGAALSHTIETGEPFDFEEDFTSATGEQRRVRSRGERETVDGLPVALVGVFQDITDHHVLQSQLRRSADSDELTGIANRAAFNRMLSDAIACAHRDGRALMLALVDLDGFKEINDTLGHLAGDDVLRSVGKRLQGPWLRGSMAARLGGDEFALIVTDPALIADHAAFVSRLQAELRLPVSANGLTIAASGTVGTALLERHDNVRDFVHAADTRLYAAKRERIGNRRRRDRRSLAA